MCVCLSGGAGVSGMRASVPQGENGAIKAGVIKKIFFIFVFVERFFCPLVCLLLNTVL